MVQLIRSGVQAVRDIAESFPESQLGEPHGQELLPARKSADPSVAPVANDATLELLRVKRVEELRENSASLVHGAYFVPGAVFPEIQIAHTHSSLEITVKSAVF